jgi:hypothetical protein
MERTTVATRSCDALGTLDMRFLMKWARQRCQEAPGRQEAIASFNPWWASDTTSLTPESPRATSPRRKDVHPDPSSLVKRASLPLTCSMEANEETEVGSFGQR